jgi:hypothetical protein
MNRAIEPDIMSPGVSLAVTGEEPRVNGAGARLSRRGMSGVEARV